MSSYIPLRQNLIAPGRAGLPAISETDTRPCHFLCPRLKTICFYSADNFLQNNIWHPISLWPLITLPSVEEIQIENNPKDWNTAEISNTVAHTDPATF